MNHFIGLVGTNSDNSTNRKLLQFMQKHFSDKATIELMEIKDFPIFNKPVSNRLPEVVKKRQKKLNNQMV
ncbi:hypothetical protein YG2_21330 [Tetragenococcus halophilus]|nr:hypothetical protein YG2_21330 [Tetragenococcus halophilus]